MERSQWDTDLLSMSTIEEKKALLSVQSDFGAITQEFVHGSNSFVFISK